MQLSKRLDVWSVPVPSVVASDPKYPQQCRIQISRDINREAMA
jgi:hypothetical protein